MTEDRSKMREDSLIKNFEILKSDKNMYAHKIVLTSVKNIDLIYYTNSEKFIKSLANFKGENFVITYAIAEVTEGIKDVNNRIVRVKLPKK